MTTYTVYSAEHGSVYGRNLTAEEAMSKLLTHDGYRYEIRKGEYKGEVCWELWHSDGSQNSTRGARHMVKTVTFSFEEDEADATQEIAEEVIKAGWSRMPECMADEDYDAMQAEVAREQAEDE